MSSQHTGRLYLKHSRGALGQVIAFEAVRTSIFLGFGKPCMFLKGQSPPVGVSAPPFGSSAEGVQIDLLFDRPDGIVQICEIKYSGAPYGIDKAEAQNLARKVRVSAQDKDGKTNFPLLRHSFSPKVYPLCGRDGHFEHNLREFVGFCLMSHKTLIRLMGLSKHF